MWPTRCKHVIYNQTHSVLPKLVVPHFCLTFVLHAYACGTENLFSPSQILAEESKLMGLWELSSRSAERPHAHHFRAGENSGANFID